MAIVSLILDTRKKSKRKTTGLYPVVLKVRHLQVRMIRMDVYTSPTDWNSKTQQLRKSILVNKGLDCEQINQELDTKFYIAKQLLREIGESIRFTTVDNLVTHLKKKLDYNPDSDIKKKIENEIDDYRTGAKSLLNAN